MKVSNIRAFGAAALIALCVSMATAAPSYAAQLYWTYHTYTSMSDCFARAHAAADLLGMEEVESTEHEVRGMMGPRAYATMICIPTGNGAVGMVAVAGDGTTRDSGIDAGAIRDGLSRAMQRAR